MGVGQEDDAALRDQHGKVERSRSLTLPRGPMISVTLRRCRAKRPSSPQIIASASPRFSGERRNYGRVGANHQAGRLLRHAAPAGKLDQQVDVAAVARVLLGIDQLEVGSGPDAQRHSASA